MGRWIREHGLVTVNLLLFLCFLVGMTIAGWQVSGIPTLGTYLASGDFWEALSENWESEFLQMSSYVALTIFLFQKGSSESKPIGRPAPQDEDPRRHAADAAAPWPVRRGGVVLVIYENSLLLLFVLLFIAAFVVHDVSGAAAYGTTPLDYLGTAQFWFESFQNWQSEFMVVALLAGAAVYLRQRGSGESKPVHAPHSETGA